MSSPTPKNYFGTPISDAAVATMLGGWDAASDVVLISLTMMRESIEAAAKPNMPDEIAEDIDLLKEVMAVQLKMAMRAARWRSFVRLKLVEYNGVTRDSLSDGSPEDGSQAKWPPFNPYFG